MIKTILLPSDFSIRSLQILKVALEEHPEDLLNIVHVTGVSLPHGITDLLFFSQEDTIKKLSNKMYDEACQIILNKYGSKINNMRFEIFTGFTHGAFNLFVTSNKIDQVYIPKNKLTFKRPCFDLTPFMKKCNVPQRVVSWNEPVEEEMQENQLSGLFRNWA